MLLLGAGCATTQELEIYKVLVIDGAEVPPEAQPLDLQAMARSQGCAYVSVGAPWVAMTVTIESVVSPYEFVVRGRYGVERVRPRLAGATVARLQQLAGREGEVVARLSASLVGMEVIEPSEDLSPAASTDGRRLVRLASPDLELLTNLMNDILDAMLEGVGRDSDSRASPGGASARVSPDFSRVPLDEESLATRVARAVEVAERYSEFRAPADLVVKRISFGGRPELSPALWSAWREQSVGCLGNPDSEKFWWDPDAMGISLPGGAIFLDSRVEWCELEMHFTLLHELMHQHQYALCESGVLLGGLPAVVRQAHASSLALAILEESGADEEALDFVAAWDPSLAGVQAFDELRNKLGLTPDECLLQLQANPDQATWLARRIEFGMWCCAPPDTAANEGPLAFEITGHDPGGPVIAIVNESEQPFAGYFSGSWHWTTVDSRTWYGGGTPPFALQLPSHGQLLLKTHVGSMAGGAIDSCHAAYRMTPSPIFDLGALQPSVADGGSG